MHARLCTQSARTEIHAPVQKGLRYTHTFYLQMLATQYHIKHTRTQTQQIYKIVHKESQKQTWHSHSKPYRSQNNGCCQQSNSVLFLSNERITPTFLINKLTKHYKSPTLPDTAEICTHMTAALSLWYMCWLIK